MVASSLNIGQALCLCPRSTPSLPNGKAQLAINSRPTRESFASRSRRSGLSSETPGVGQSKARQPSLVVGLEISVHLSLKYVMTLRRFGVTSVTALLAGPYRHQRGKDIGRIGKTLLLKTLSPSVMAGQGEVLWELGWNGKEPSLHPFHRRNPKRIPSGRIGLGPGEGGSRAAHTDGVPQILRVARLHYRTGPHGLRWYVITKIELQ